MKMYHHYFVCKSQKALPIVIDICRNLFPRLFIPEVSLGLSVWQRSLPERDSMDVWKKCFGGLLTIKYGNVYMFCHVFGNKYGVKGSFCCYFPEAVESCLKPLDSCL